MDKFKQLTKAYALETGMCAPTIFVEGAKGKLVTNPLAGADSSEERIVIMFLTGERVSREKYVGELKQVCFVSEGWMAVPHDGNFVQPSKDPDRIETILFSSLLVEENKQVLEILKMVRDQNGKLIDLLEFSMPKAVEVQSDLLPAFVAGYISTSRVSQ